LKDENSAVRIAQALVSGGANVNARDVLGQSPLTAARKKKREILATYLVSVGANDA
jgi:hypothetical protein